MLNFLRKEVHCLRLWVWALNRLSITRRLWVAFSLLRQVVRTCRTFRLCQLLSRQSRSPPYKSSRSPLSRMPLSDFKHPLIRTRIHHSKTLAWVAASAEGLRPGLPGETSKRSMCRSRKGSWESSSSPFKPLFRRSLPRQYLKRVTLHHHSSQVIIIKGSLLSSTS